MLALLNRLTSLAILGYLAYFFVSGDFRRAPEALPFLVCTLAGFWLAGKSYEHLSAEGAKQPLSVLWKGALAPRSDFTAEGWRLRWQAAAVFFTGFLVSVVWMFARD